MTDWSLMDREWFPPPQPSPYDPYQYNDYPFYKDKMQQQSQNFLSPPTPPAKLMLSKHQVPPPAPNPGPLMPVPMPMPYMSSHPISRGDNPRELRNRAEKMRRDKLNQSIAKLASIVPTVVTAGRKINKTGVLRLTAHYLRAHQYVFGDATGHAPEFPSTSTRVILALLNGFLLTTTYKGVIVVVSQNISEYLGYAQVDLLGQNIFNYTHEEDHMILRDQLMPRSQTLGAHGELVIPNEPGARERIAAELANEKRHFIIRLRKMGQRSEPPKYVTCNVEGSLRKSDRESHGYNKCCQVVRRARARSDNTTCSGNDVVFVGLVRPTTETFMNDSALEAYRLEYRTRHSVDGEIIQCEQRIALVTGYMIHEVNGLNAMNFIHRDEVGWVVVALREMYNRNQMFGESCYRLMTKNGQFIYLRTRGRLDVDTSSRSVTSFLCTNTVVDEEEGKHLIRMMKEKYNFLTNQPEPVDDVTDSQSGLVEDPKEIEKKILNLVRNLPPPRTLSSSSTEFCIIPPNPERIVKSIDKIYNVIKSISQYRRHRNDEFDDQGQASNASSCTITELTDSTPNPEPTDSTTSGDHTTDYFDEQIKADLAYYQGPDYNQPMVYNAELPNELLLVNNNFATEYKEPLIDYKEPLTDFKELTEYTEPLTDYTELTELAVASTSGIKRPNNFELEDMTSKKKIIDMTKEEGAASLSGANTPSLDVFFDEATLNQEIEKAINSLEEPIAIDPNFPDFLVSTEIQDILENLEEEQNIVT